MTTFSNSGGGDFRTDGNWSSGHHPLNGGTADISNTFSGADYTVAVTDAEAAALINITAANADLFISNLGVLTAGTINATAGTLNVGGEISGGKVVFNNNAVLLPQGGTLNGVTWEGTLALNALGVSDSLEVASSLSVLNAAGNGPGEIDITGPSTSADLDFESSMTLNSASGGNLVINLGSSTTNTQYLSIGSNISLTLGTAVSLNQVGAGSTLSLIDNGGAFGGTIVNDGTIMLTTGPGSGASVTASNFINNGTIIDVGGGLGGALPGEDLELSPGNTFEAGPNSLIEVSGYGLVHITGPNGSIDLSGTIKVSSHGTVDLDTASVAVSDTLGAGVVQISTFGTLEVNYDYKGTATFLDPTGVLALGNEGGGYTGAVVGLQAFNSATHDVIDLLLTTGITSLQPHFTSPVSGILDVMDNTTTLASINLIGDYVGFTFGFGSDGQTTPGTDIFVGCFAAGSRILTDRGEVPVESLREGDLAVTLSEIGAKCGPVRWIGVARIDIDRHPRPRAVTPIRILAGAFGDDLPHRDLLLSPDHAVYVDGVLIPIQYLENGATIRREAIGGVVTYYHVELDEHAVLVADGLPVESYLDTGGRANFLNGGGVRALYPEFAARRWETQGCAPLIVTGPALRAVRDRLNSRVPASVDKVFARSARPAALV